VLQLFQQTKRGGDDLLERLKNSSLMFWSIEILIVVAIIWVHQNQFLFLTNRRFLLNNFYAAIVSWHFVLYVKSDR
jgi:hypothetical protein